MRSATHAYGCDICQEVCPWNLSPSTGITHDRPWQPRPGLDRPRLIDLWRQTDDELRALLKGSAMKRAGVKRLRRNLAVAIGNSGDRGGGCRVAGSPRAHLRRAARSRACRVGDREARWLRNPAAASRAPESRCRHCCRTGRRCRRSATSPPAARRVTSISEERRRSSARDRRRAGIMFVGEQPGDAEDLAGHPFVGPAGRLLDRALEDAGIDRSDLSTSPTW